MAEATDTETTAPFACSMDYHGSLVEFEVELLPAAVLAERMQFELGEVPADEPFMAVIGRVPAGTGRFDVEYEGQRFMLTSAVASGEDTPEVRAQAEAAAAELIGIFLSHHENGDAEDEDVLEVTL